MAPRHDPTPAERARRMRNLAVALLLSFLVVLFFVMTMVQLGSQVGR